MSGDNELWDQFRRLLLGTVVEALLERGTAVDFSSIHIAFSDDSVFRVPRIDNYMRFKGELTANVTSQVKPGDDAGLRSALAQAWPSILKVVDIPIGDRLTVDKNQLDVRLDDGELHVAFDLVAD